MTNGQPSGITTNTARGRGAAGPVAPRRAGALRPLGLDAVVLSREGQLGQWQQLNRDSTIPHCLDNLETSGVLDNLRRVAGRSAAGFTGYWFADSDLHKTLEALGWD